METYIVKISNGRPPPPSPYTHTTTTCLNRRRWEQCWALILATSSCRFKALHHSPNRKWGSGPWSSSPINIPRNLYKQYFVYLLLAFQTPGEILKVPVVEKRQASPLDTAVLGPEVKQTKVPPNGSLERLRVDEKLYQAQTWLQIA